HHLLTGLGLHVHTTNANLNNLIGVPQTILATPIDADVALIECGISEQGEMQRLANILSPDGVVMTGMTSAHSEGLGGLEGVVKEKARLLSAVKTDGWCALGNGVADDLKQQDIDITCQSIQNEVTWKRQGLDVTFYDQHQSADLRLALPADHWCENMALVLSIALATPWNIQISADFQDLVKLLSTWSAVEGRLQTYQGFAGCQILDDAYNANPVSMQAALHTLQAMPTRRIAILGDMKELGDTSLQAHATLNVQNIDGLWLVGEAMKVLHEQHPTSQWFLNVDALLAWLAANMENIMQGDTVLVKASHSMGLEKVVEMLKVKDVDCAV
ncbi:MAG: Mur ligase family protein, partial [Mariprofundaceae bacterium]|nr:Mur ligase family protein [Mariprofundaceae bacterium]